MEKDQEEITIQEIIEILIGTGCQPSIENVCEYCKLHKFKKVKV